MLQVKDVITIPRSLSISYNKGNHVLQHSWNKRI